MKKIAAVIVLAVISTNVFGQSLSANASGNEIYAVSPIVVNKQGLGNYEVTTPPGLKMRNTGRTLTILGSALFVGGMVVFSSADEKYYSSTTTSYGSNTEGDPKAALGTLMLMGGAGMAVPGIIFWSKGDKKYKRYLEKQEASFSIKGAGLSVSYRF